MTQVNDAQARPLTSSEQDWLDVRDFMREHRYELSVAAADDYPNVPKVAGTPLLTAEPWLPKEPVDLQQIQLDLVSEARFAGLTGREPVTESVRPLRPDGSRYASYSGAIAELAAPAVFENRATYRLLDADLLSPQPVLRFGRGAYFDGIDTGEAVGHEYAAQRLNPRSGDAFRTAIGSPVNTTRRPTNLAISALTIRHDGSSGDARFLLHWRDPAKVGHAGGLYQVVPVGVFQPANDDPSSERNDFSLWRCLVREFAEELLGHAEPDSAGGPIDYDGWRFATRMTDELRAGSIRAYCLGLGVDALTLATDLLVAVVIEASVFDDLFGRLVRQNSEGTILDSSVGSSRDIPGIPFDRAEVERYSRREPLQAAGAALLAQAWLHRAALLAG